MVCELSHKLIDPMSMRIALEYDCFQIIITLAASEN